MPAASEGRPLPPLPHRFRPRGVRYAAVVFGAVLVLVTAAIWFAFPDRIQEQFTLFQKLTVFTMGAGFFVAFHALARGRVDADEEGVLIVNGYRSHRYAWSQIVAVSLRPGDPWAVFDLSDGTSKSALGIQGSDGGFAQAQVRLLRALVEAHAAVEPDEQSGADPVDRTSDDH